MRFHQTIQFLDGSNSLPASGKQGKKAERSSHRWKNPEWEEHPGTQPWVISHETMTDHEGEKKIEPAALKPSLTLV